MILVTGAGGFIGHHLVKRLVSSGEKVRGVDLKQPEYEPSPAAEFWCADLRDPDQCRKAVDRVSEVYHLAADMGGIGYITAKHAEVAHNNVLIDANMLKAAYQAQVDRVFYASSACVYPQYLQCDTDSEPLAEEDVYPADPEPGYGWEKLFAEQLCLYYQQDYGLKVRIARFHNIFGPLGTYDGGREKAPAALCRKIALAPDGGEVELWGDGRQRRSFLYVDDCVDGILALTRSDLDVPVNLGSVRSVTVDQLAEMISDLAGKTIRFTHRTTAPQGVRGRNSDNRLVEEQLGWSPLVDLEEGLRATYHWIASRIGGT